MTNQDRFQKLLDKKGVRYFSAKEVFFRGSSDSRLHLNTDPPREYWNHIIPTLEMLDKLRQVIGYPISIVSCYRGEAYNRRIGGARFSQHKEFRAIDFQSYHVAPSTMFDILKGYRNAGEFKGGLGLYRTFVHIDTRGRNSSWAGSGVSL